MLTFYSFSIIHIGTTPVGIAIYNDNSYITSSFLDVTMRIVNGYDINLDTWTMYIYLIGC